MNRNTIDNIHAFTKLYGYIRLFHPSDEACSVDWDRFVVYGLQQVMNADSSNELSNILLELFLPVAPSIEIYETQKGLEYDLTKIIPQDKTGLTPVAWQRLGMSLNEKQKFDIYKKCRIGRFRTPEKNYSEISKRFSAAEFRGRKLRAKGTFCIDTDFEGYEACFFLDIYGNDGKIIRRSEIKLDSDTYKEYNLEVLVPAEASEIKIGCKQTREGMFFIHGIMVEVLNDTRGQNEIVHTWDFESQDLNQPPIGWEYTLESSIIEVIDYNPYKGTKCCFVESYFEKQLFDKYPLPGELIQKPISNKLSCVVPLALYSDDTGTLQHADTEKFEDLVRKLSGIDIDSLTYENLYVRLAGVVILWNVVQHSYPYFELYDIDWEGVLDEEIESVCNCESEIEYVNALNMLLAKLNDGHCRVEYDGDEKVLFSPPFTLVYAEECHVINRVVGDNGIFRLGDVIKSIDGIPVNEAASDAAKYISSATEGWKTRQVTLNLVKGTENSSIKLEILRDGKIIDIETTRCISYRQLIESRNKAGKSPAAIEELRPGIYYLDLSRAKLREIDEMAKILSSATGIIFDVRSYPKLHFGFLGYLTDKPMLSQKWNIPQIIYPDHNNFVGYNTDGRWTIPPLEPRFQGKMVFLTGPGAISYGESLMGIVEAYKLGDIVGEATAGTNGDINPVNLPGGYTAYYTGTKVLKHDGCRHHGIGIKPTVYCPKTIEGITEGRDEQLEKAIEIIELFSK